MGEDYPGQKRQQDMFQYCMACSFALALTFGWVFDSVRVGWYTYLAGVVLTWLINIVEWGYFFDPATQWAEGKYLDVTSYWDLEARDRMAVNQLRDRLPKQRSQITMSGGPARMTISSRPMPEFRFKRWVLNPCSTKNLFSN
uniref:Signal peptidase complex subunit 1 n=2 Tax=Physcomitrium patens TaxID=3218 RepID=A9STZ8_PHYPA|nr:hypothetical protein PHYPA_016616 [Physcomitrium patens]